MHYALTQWKRFSVHFWTVGSQQPTAKNKTNANKSSCLENEPAYEKVVNSSSCNKKLEVILLKV